MSPRIELQVQSPVNPGRQRHALAVGLLLVVCAIPRLAAGQTPEARPRLTLAAALEIAEGRSESIALARTALVRNDGDLVRAKSARRPQLSGTATYERSLANEFQGVFDDIDFGGGGDGIRRIDSASTTCRSAAPTPGARRSRSRRTCIPAGASARRNGWSPSGVEAAEQALTATRAQVLFDVTQAYYDAALSDRLVAIAEATLDQAGATLRQVQAGFDAGTQPEFEVLRATGQPRQPDAAGDPPARQPRRRAAASEADARTCRRTADLQLADVLGRRAPGAAAAVRRSGRGDREQRCRTDGATTFTLQSNVPLPERNAVAEAQTAVQAARGVARGGAGRATAQS